MSCGCGFINMIEIAVTDGVPLVWRAEDVSELRENHHIVGNLVGSLPRYPKQDVHLGLPLQLLPEEATLLRDKGLAVLKDHSTPRRLPTVEEVQAFKNTRQRIFDEQVVYAKVDKRKQLERLQGDIEEGRKAKLQKKANKGTEQQTDQSGKTEQELLEQSSFDIEAELKKFTLPNKAALIQIPTAEPQGTAHSEANWTYPVTADDQLKYRVFTHLWQEGYFLTSGAKFGGHFLAYPGDPGRYHSFYVVICVDKDRALTALDVSTFARLGSNVKKTVLLCSEDSADKLTFTSLQWTGIT